MKFYFAPMEGITGYVQRNAFHTSFPLIDKYVTAFIAPNQKRRFSSKEQNDILPEHNEGLFVVPQLMTNQAQDFLETVSRLRLFGYQEVNLNLGCPSKTVVSKGRGSGFLAKPKELDIFLKEVFSSTDVEVSIKTRIGVHDPEEMYKLLDIYNQYPIKELIVHPRTQSDFYKNTPNLKVFDYVSTHSRAPVCYNGDIVTIANYRDFVERFPEVDCMMIGRGLLRNPGLVSLIKHGIVPNKEVIRKYHDKVYQDYQLVLFGEKTVLFKMKELWSYMIRLFCDSKKLEKKIKKAERLSVYEEVVESIFSELEIDTEAL